MDADIVAYRCSASCTNGEPEEVSFARADELLRRILYQTNADYQICYLSGEGNFRLQYNPEYKANRKNMQRPAHLAATKQYLVEKWDAERADGEEADDLLGIYQSSIGDSVICSIDKDLLQVPGHHYNFVKESSTYVSPVEGLQNFYYQLIMGDRVDNIFGYDGIARQTVPKKLQWAIDELMSYTIEQDMFDFVRDMYNDDDRLLMNGRCLWVRREKAQIWEFPK